MDKRRYPWLLVTTVQERAYDDAYRKAWQVSHCKTVAEWAGERAIFFEMQQSRRERQKAQATT